MAARSCAAECVRITHCGRCPPWGPTTTSTGLRSGAGRPASAPRSRRRSSAGGPPWSRSGAAWAACASTPARSRARPSARRSSPTPARRQRGDRLPWARPASRPTAEQLLAGVEAVIAREIEVIEQQLRRNDVTLIQGEASFLDPHTLAIRGESRREPGHGAPRRHRGRHAAGAAAGRRAGRRDRAQLATSSSNLKKLPRTWPWSAPA